MSSLPGEQALKDGLSFEFSWTAFHLIELLEERAISIQLGGLAFESGIDFRLQYEDREENHQVKRALGTKSVWSFASLDNEGVLRDFKNRLVNERVYCHFVSTLPATPLGNLAERAAKCSDYGTFAQSSLNSEYSKWLNDLINRWGLPAETCWSNLRRIETRHIDERSLERTILTVLRPLVIGNPQNVLAHLKDFCFYHVHQTIRSSDIWRWLGQKGIQRQIIVGDTRVIGRLEAQTKRYTDNIRSKLIQPPLKRPIVDEVVSKMRDSRYSQDLVILGSPGGGKSAVMLQIVDACKEMGWPILAFRLDEMPAALTPTGMQEELDLPAPPAQSIALASAGKPALVVIDQLDAVSQYSGRTGNLYDRVGELIKDLNSYRLRNPIHLVTACREVDWNHDRRFRQAFLKSLPPEDADNTFNVAKLSDEEITLILKGSGFNIASFSGKQRELLLRYPQYLAILIETHPDPETLQGILTPKHLFDAYWDKKQREASDKFRNLSGNPWREVLQHITTTLSETALKLAPPLIGGFDDDQAPLAISSQELERFSPLLIEWMLSSGVLSKGPSRYRFGHESLFDYCFARFFKERGESLLEYLLRSDQTLIQRGQSRQVLAYLRDEDMQVYLTTVSHLLESDAIRPHLKQLVIVSFFDVTEPTLYECNFITPYLIKSFPDFDTGLNETLPCQVFNAFSASLAFFRLFCRVGIFSEWFTTRTGLSRGRLLRVLLQHQENAQEEVWRQLVPIVDDDHFSDELNWLAHFCKASQSRETFEWLINLMRQNVQEEETNKNHSDRFYSLGVDLANNQPQWFAEWVAALIRARMLLGDKAGIFLLKEHAVQAESIKSAAKSDPISFVTHVLPAAIESLESLEIRGSAGCFHVSYSDEEDRYHSLDENLLISLVDCLDLSLQNGNPRAEEWMEKLEISTSKVCRRLYATVLCGNHPRLTFIAAKALRNGERMFSTLNFRNNYAACVILRNHAPRFHPDALSDIVEIILKYYPSWQNRPLRESWGPSKPMCLGNYRGNLQMMLLRSVPFERLSAKARKRLAELERKFSFEPGLPSRRDVKPVNSTAAAAWSPARFLSVINKRNSRSKNVWRRSTFHWDTEIHQELSSAIKANPEAFSGFLSSCDSSTEPAFVRIVADQLSECSLQLSIVEDVVLNLRRLGNQWAQQTVRIIGKLPKETLNGWLFDLLVEYATEFPVSNESFTYLNDDNPAQRLHCAAINSVRGMALGVLMKKLWEDPIAILSIEDVLRAMMKGPDQAILTEAASICYAVATTTQTRPFAFELFHILVDEGMTDEHVLASRWPSEFIRVGLWEHWATLRPIVARMVSSPLVDVSAMGARLACIAAVLDTSALELAEPCFTSGETKVRAECARVIAYHVGTDGELPWMPEAFIKLADDSEIEVCRAVCSAFSRNRFSDFRLWGDLLPRFLLTRSFVVQPGELIRAVSESPNVLPETVFDVIQALIDRLNEPTETTDDRLHYHLTSATSAIKRLYHENRDNELRRTALDMIDALCVHGNLSSDKIDD